MFADRVDAGRQLGERLRQRRDEDMDIVVLGLPRGGVPVAAEVARALDAPLDVIVVRKLGVPFQPELAMGAIGEGRGEGGVRVLAPTTIRCAAISKDTLAAVERRERAELQRRSQRFRANFDRIPLAGRTAMIVDDGIATGSTARAACDVARAQGASRVVLAVPVAPVQCLRSLRRSADDVICLRTPRPFFAIGEWYQDFSQTSDEEVIACLRRARNEPAPSTRAIFAEPTDDPSDRDEEVEVRSGDARLAGHLTVPASATGIVAFAHGSGSSRHSPRNRFVAAMLNQAGLGTLLLDLLTATEELDRATVFDVELLARRLMDATAWLHAQPELRSLRIGYFGASTGAAAALWAAAEMHSVELQATERQATERQATERQATERQAAELQTAGPDGRIAAVVSRGGRPDLAASRLAEVSAPTMLIVGGHDEVVHTLNRRAQAQLRCLSRLAVVPGATHLFEEPGALEAVAELARDWFLQHCGPVAAEFADPGATPHPSAQPQPESRVQGR